MYFIPNGELYSLAPLLEGQEPGSDMEMCQCLNIN